MKKNLREEKYTGMVIFNDNKKEFRMCDVEVNDNELILNLYSAITC